MDIKALVGSLKPEKEKTDPKNKRKYVQFTMDEWTAMETGAGGSLETSDVKALVQGIFAGKVTIQVPKPAK